MNKIGPKEKDGTLKGVTTLGHRQLIFWYSFPSDSSKMDPTQIKNHLHHFIFYCPPTQHISQELLIPQKWFTYGYLQN